MSDPNVNSLMDEFMDVLVRMESNGIDIVYRSDPNLTEGYTSIRVDIDVPKPWGDDDDE